MNSQTTQQTVTAQEEKPFSHNPINPTENRYEAGWEVISPESGNYEVLIKNEEYNDHSYDWRVVYRSLDSRFGPPNDLGKENTFKTHDEAKKYVEEVISGVHGPIEDMLG